MKRHISVIFTVFISLLFLAASAPEQRPSNWAAPVSLDGAPNLFKVSAHLYRSAQPTAQGFKNLKALGIKTIVNLRLSHSDAELIKETGLELEQINMKSWRIRDEDAVKFLKIVTDTQKTPVLVHCQHGADRTGSMVAVYRIAVQGWSKEDAMKELKEGGYNFHSIWANIPYWIKDLDVDKIRKEAGITNAK
jgi:protein tyrosine/serine phosphatase